MSDPLNAKIVEDGTDGRDSTRMSQTRRSALTGSPGFPAAVAALCLAASLSLGLGMIYVQPLFMKHPPTVDARVSGGTWSDTSTAMPTTTGNQTMARTGPSGTPVGFVRHTGPAGLVTVLPISFTVVNGATAGTVVARNQFDPVVEVRFGGAPTEGDDGLFETIVEAARGTSSSRAGYRQLALTQTRHGDREAVDWEFRYDTPQGEPRRSRSHYWRVNGIEYVLLAQAPPERWTEASRLLDTMIGHCYTP